MNKTILSIVCFLQLTSSISAQDMFRATEQGSISSSFSESKKTISYIKKSTLVAFESNSTVDSWVMFKGNIENKNLQFHASRVRISSKKVVGLFNRRTENCDWSVHFLNTSSEATVLGNKKIMSKDGVSSAFSEVWYKHIYTDIDARFYSSKEGIQYSMIVKPMADIDQIAIKWQGVERLHIEKQNTLLYNTPDGTKCRGKVRAYQLIDGEEIEVDILLHLHKNTLRFKPLFYNRDYPLVIDTPVLVSVTKED